MTVLSVFANSYAADGGLGAWTTPTNVYADDGTYATRVGTTKNVVYGNLFGFDLSTLPDGVTINSVTLTAQWHNSAADTNGPILTLGVLLAAAVYGSANDTTGQIADEVHTYAPTGLTAANLKATGGQGFWAILRFTRSDNTAHTASVDYVKCEVDYSVSEITGAAAITLDAVGQALSGAVSISGLSAVAFDGIGAGITGALSIVGACAVAFDGIGASITGTTQSQSEITGVLDATCDGLSISANGAGGIAGTVGTTLDGIGATISGAAGIAANVNITLDALTGAGQGAVIITGESSNTFSSMSIGSTGLIGIAGGVSKTLDSVTGEIIGVVGNSPVTGLLDAIFSGLSCQAVGTVAMSGRENPTKHLIVSRGLAIIQTSALPVIESREYETPKRENYVSTD